MKVMPEAGNPHPREVSCRSNSHISSLNHCVPTSFDSDDSSKSLSSLGLEHLDVQKSLLSSEFHQNDTFTVNYNFQSSTPILLSYYHITTPAISPILPSSLSSPPLNSSAITLSLHPSLPSQPLMSVPVTV